MPTWKSSELSSIVSGEVVVANHFMRQNSIRVSAGLHGLGFSGNHQPKCDPGSGSIQAVARYRLHPRSPRTRIRKG